MDDALDNVEFSYRPSFVVDSWTAETQLKEIRAEVLTMQNGVVVVCPAEEYTELLTIQY